LVKEIQSLGLSVELIDSEKNKQVIADKMIEENYEADAESIESPTLLEADSTEIEDLAIIDTSDSHEIDEFEALNEDASEEEESFDEKEEEVL